MYVSLSCNCRISLLPLIVHFYETGNELLVYKAHSLRVQRHQYFLFEYKDNCNVSGL